jgi:chromosome partitioning protein
MTTLAFFNQKGGVGKTTTVANVAAGMRRRGLDTLLVDLDPQSNLTYVCGADQGRAGTLEILTLKAAAADVVQSTRQGDFISSSAALGAEGVPSGAGRERRLLEALSPIAGIYDCVLLDCPPSLGALSACALVAADGVVVPVQADVLSLQALGRLGATLESVRRNANPSLVVYGIAITRHNPRTLLGREAAEMLADTAARLGTKVYDAPIREATAIKEAQAARTDVLAHAPGSGAALDYARLADLIIEDMGRYEWRTGK